MRLGIMALTAAVVMATGAHAAERVDDFEIEIAAPSAGATKERQAVQPVMTQASSRQKTPDELLWDRAEAQSSGMDFGTAFASGVMASVISQGAAKPTAQELLPVDAMPEIPADSSCVLPELPAQVKVDLPSIPRFSLTANAHSYKITAGDTIAKAVTEIQKMTGDRLESERIIAAIFRENPAAFTANGLVAGKIINVPTDERIALENPATGQEVMNAANASKLKSYKLPALVLPWAEEDAQIKAQQAEADKVDAIRAQAKKSVLACLADEKARREAQAKKAEEQRKMAETPADIADDSFMIKDDDESDTQVTFNEQGKRVITFKNDRPSGNLGNGADVSGSTDGVPSGGMVVAAGNGVSGTSLVLGGRNGSVGLNSQGKVNPRGTGTASSAEELKKSQAEVTRLKDEITQLRSRYEAEAERNAKDMNELKGMMSQLLDKRNPAVDGENNEAQGSGSPYIILAIGLGFLLLLGAGGYLYMRIKLNKMRRALLDAEESENSNCPDLDGSNETLNDDLNIPTGNDYDDAKSLSLEDNRSEPKA